MVIHFDVNTAAGVKAVELAMVKDRKLFTAADREDEKNAGSDRISLYDCGCICEIKQVVKLPGNIVRVLVEGVMRARIHEITSGESVIATVKEIVASDDWYLGKTIGPVDPDITEDNEQVRLQIMGKINVLKELLTTMLGYNPQIARNLTKQFEEASLMK